MYVCLTALSILTALFVLVLVFVLSLSLPCPCLVLSCLCLVLVLSLSLSCPCLVLVYLSVCLSLCLSVLYTKYIYYIQNSGKCKGEERCNRNIEQNIEIFINMFLLKTRHIGAIGKFMKCVGRTHDTLACH